MPARNALSKKSKSGLAGKSTKNRSRDAGSRRKGRRRPIAAPAAARARDEGGLFPIVGVGASAGGLEAFTQLLKHLSGETGMAFVLVQHLDPSHRSLLPEILSKATTMPVLQVSDGTVMKPNRVYVMPPNVEMVIRGGTLRLLRPREPRGHRMPIDTFLRSLAEDRKSGAIEP